MKITLMINIIKNINICIQLQSMVQYCYCFFFLNGKAVSASVVQPSYRYR